MKFYDKYFANNYDELITYYPRFYRDVYEMTEILKAHGRIADELEANIEQTFLNAFADYADEKTLTKLERFFRITYDEPRSLVSRRSMIKAMLLGQRHVGRKEIKEIISVFTDGEVDVELIDGMIRITVTRDLGDTFDLRDCYFIFSSRIPAHLSLGMVDKALPVSVLSDNLFVFSNLKITLAAQNHSAIINGVMLNGEKPLDGSWKLDSARIGIPFIDFGATAILPKNENVYTFSALTFSDHFLPNKLGLSLKPQIGFSAKTQSAIRSVNVGAKILFRNPGAQFQGAAETDVFGGVMPRKIDISGLAACNSFKATTGIQINVSAKQRNIFRQETNKVAGLSAKQPFGFKGSVVMDGRWALNGDFILNGSRSLNQFFSKEDL